MSVAVPSNSCWLPGSLVLGQLLKKALNTEDGSNIDFQIGTTHIRLQIQPNKQDQFFFFNRSTVASLGLVSPGAVK